MKAENPVETLARAVYSAVAADLQPVSYEFKTPTQRVNKLPGEQRMRRPSVIECEVYHFPQTWPSTALGFGGIGGSAMTDAYTTVVVHQKQAAVYFDGRFAYAIERVGRNFMDDVRFHHMRPKDDLTDYVEEIHVAEYGETSDTQNIP